MYPPEQARQQPVGMTCDLARVPEQHPSMTTTLEHFESGEMPPSAKILGGLTIAPAVAAVVVDGVPIVDPQVAPII